MMTARPLFENDATKAVERAIAKECAEAWGYDFEKINALSYGPDFAMLRRGCGDHPPVDFYLEAKGRNWRYRDGDGYWLSVLKVRSCWALKQCSGTPSRLAVRFDDGVIRWTRMNLHSDRVIWAGRKDRNGSPGDMEPCFVFDWAAFEELR
jgi:hypothetical protein